MIKFDYEKTTKNGLLKLSGNLITKDSAELERILVRTFSKDEIIIVDLSKVISISDKCKSVLSDFVVKNMFEKKNLQIKFEE